jgi:hypothetical protein
MKKREDQGIDIEIDVDNIGSQPSKLTKEEEKMISDYIRSHKTKMRQKSIKGKVNV